MTIVENKKIINIVDKLVKNVGGYNALDTASSLLKFINDETHDRIEGALEGLISDLLGEMQGLKTAEDLDAYVGNAGTSPRMLILIDALDVLKTFTTNTGE